MLTLLAYAVAPSVAKIPFDPLEEAERAESLTAAVDESPTASKIALVP